MRFKTIKRKLRNAALSENSLWLIYEQMFGKSDKKVAVINSIENKFFSSVLKFIFKKDVPAVCGCKIDEM